MVKYIFPIHCNKCIDINMSFIDIRLNCSVNLYARCMKNTKQLNLVSVYELNCSKIIDVNGYVCHRQGVSDTWVVCSMVKELSLYQ